MALYKSLATNTKQQAIIWKIEESESFFSDNLGFVAQHKTEKRRLEFLASRYLLKYLIPDFSFSDLKSHREGKPFFEDDRIHFSISHSFPFVAVVIDEQPVGIDVQVFQEKILRLQQKFLSAEEQIIFDNSMEHITLAWAAKEAAFKWFGEGQVDFIQHMPIRKLILDQQSATMEMDFLRIIPKKELIIAGGIESDFAWAII